jgi:hypothetical protein
MTRAITRSLRLWSIGLGVALTALQATPSLAQSSWGPGFVEVSTALSTRQHIDVVAEWVDTDQGESAEETNVDQMLARLPAVEYRLDMRSMRGKTMTLHIALPTSATASAARVVMRWRGQQFGSGSLTPGERRPIWQGVVNTDVLIESLMLEFLVDSRGLAAPLSLTPVFLAEIK